MKEKNYREVKMCEKCGNRDTTNHPCLDMRDFGTTLESIKHIGDWIDGKLVCRPDCPSVTHPTSEKPNHDV